MVPTLVWVAMLVVFVASGWAVVRQLIGVGWLLAAVIISAGLVAVLTVIGLSTSITVADDRLVYQRGGYRTTVARSDISAIRLVRESALPGIVAARLDVYDSNGGLVGSVPADGFSNSALEAVAQALGVMLSEDPGPVDDASGSTTRN